MNFKSLSALTRDIHEWIPTLEERFDCVVGIPRSGMIVANILALKLGIPFGDLDGFLEGRLLGLGDRYSHVNPKEFLKAKRKVLVVDDSISSGNAMRRARAEIKKSNCSHELTFMAAYVTSRGRKYCDSFIEEIANPRRFEWNILSSPLIGNYCFDLDGVLCVHQPPDSVKNESEIREKILSARPLYLPTHPIGVIVTNRSEKFRSETEEWLSIHRVSYSALCMRNGKHANDHPGKQGSAELKAEIYRKSGCDLFIESDSNVAVQIVKLSNKFVYALDAVEMLRPGAVSNFLQRKKITTRKNYHRFWSRLRTLLRVNGRIRRQEESYPG